MERAEAIDQIQTELSRLFCVCKCGWVGVGVGGGGEKAG